MPSNLQLACACVCRCESHSLRQRELSERVHRIHFLSLALSRSFCVACSTSSDSALLIRPVNIEHCSVSSFSSVCSFILSLARATHQLLRPSSCCARSLSLVLSLSCLLLSLFLLSSLTLCRVTHTTEHTSEVTADSYNSSYYLCARVK